MANLFNLTDFQWGLLANDAYRRYQLRGDTPELGYSNDLKNALFDSNFRRYPDINFSGWEEYTLPGTQKVINLENDIFKALRENDLLGFDYKGGVTDAFSTRVYVNSNSETKKVIVAFRGSESFEEMLGGDAGELDAIYDWIGRSDFGDIFYKYITNPEFDIQSEIKGNFGVILSNKIHEQVNAAYYFTQQLKTILNSDASLSGYELAFTGHSLGGYLATAVSTIESVKDASKLPDGGINAVVFNPFGAHDTIKTLFDKGADAVIEEINKDEILFHLPPIERITGTFPDTEANVRIVYNEFDMARRGNRWDGDTQKAEAWGVDATPLANYNPDALNPISTISQIDPYYPGSIADAILTPYRNGFELFSDKLFDAPQDQTDAFLTFSRRAHAIDNQLLVMASPKAQDVYELGSLLERVPTFYLALGTPVSELEKENTSDPLSNGFVIRSLQMELVKDVLKNGYEQSILKQVTDSLKLIADANLIAPVSNTDRQSYYKIQESLSEILIESVRDFVKNFLIINAAKKYVSPFSISSNEQYFTVAVKHDADKNYFGEDRFVSSFLYHDTMKTAETLYAGYQKASGIGIQSFDDYIIALRENGNASFDAYIETTTGNDFVIAMEGDDTIVDKSGDDSYFAGNGNDLIQGGIGSDFIYGGFTHTDKFEFDGSDTVEYTTGLSNARIELFANNYSITYTDKDVSADPLQYNFPYYIVRKINNKGELLDTDYLVSIETIVGTDNDDYFTGGSGKDDFEGGGAMIFWMVAMLLT
jgi:hypothetical protein